MITRGRKRTEEEGDLNRKRLRDQAKRAKNTSKRRSVRNTVRAFTFAPLATLTGVAAAHHSRQKMPKLEDVKKSRDERGNADDIDSTKRGKNGQAEWEETNEEIT